MNPRERILRTLKGQKADRVPIVLPSFRRISHSDFEKISDPLRRRIAERVIDETEFRVTVSSQINRMLVTPPQRIQMEHEDLPNGNRRSVGVIDTPLGDLTYITEWSPRLRTGWQVKYPVENEGDIKKITSIPWERPVNLTPPDLDNLPEEFSERGILQILVDSPFVCVAGMMSFMQFLEMCATDLNLIEELTEICRQRVLDCLSVLLSKPGIEYVWLGGSEWLTPPMASPRVYDALVQEQERGIIQYIHENSDAVVHIHCHGRVRDALPKTINRGADYMEPVEPPPDGDITMAEAKEVAAGRITLGGNIECRILCIESEDSVEAAVRAAFQGGKERFILCPTERPSPVLSENEFNNYMRMIDVWEELSPME